ncbi:unnamed protein product [Penicillium egyptiacum]|uniref:Glycosyl transferase CAP10 domain-containing protein n=1 Tax=Penicillium egyptiacum TaxID=1303716 RepID=A0A9W4KCP2_9EURO|nr:unnamed protein product [Penicillium egyptiacum]
MPIFFFLNYGCERQDCSDQRMLFHVVGRGDQSEAWKYRYLLDMDGHAYSGRFYAFMRSKSVPIKLTFFREWHKNILIPWVHYVPLNKDSNEVAELCASSSRILLARRLLEPLARKGSSGLLRHSGMMTWMSLCSGLC